MAVIGLNHLNLFAPRELLEELKEFYCSVIGLEEGCRRPQASFGYWLYGGGRPILHLSETAPGETCLTHVSTTFNHMAFSCVEREAMEQALRERNVPFRKSVASNGQVQLFMQDPAGNGVELSFSV